MRLRDWRRRIVVGAGVDRGPVEAARTETTKKRTWSSPHASSGSSRRPRTSAGVDGQADRLGGAGFGRGHRPRPGRALSWRSRGASRTRRSRSSSSPRAVSGPGSRSRRGLAPGPGGGDRGTGDAARSARRLRPTSLRRGPDPQGAFRPRGTPALARRAVDRSARRRNCPAPREQPRDRCLCVRDGRRARLERVPVRERPRGCNAARDRPGQRPGLRRRRAAGEARRARADFETHYEAGYRLGRGTVSPRGLRRAAAGEGALRRRRTRTASPPTRSRSNRGLIRAACLCQTVLAEAADASPDRTRPRPAIERLRAGAGAELDPAIAEALIAVVERALGSKCSRASSRLGA